MPPTLTTQRHLTQPLAPAMATLAVLRPVAHTDGQECFSVLSVQPWEWCQPSNAFGKIIDKRGHPIMNRQWRPPVRSEANAPVLWAEFRGAVIQNAYALHLRTHKNSQSPQVTREMLGLGDGRPDAMGKWTKRLNGTAGWNFDDTAVVLRLYPGALPDWATVQVFLDVCTGVRQPPAANWNWPDTMGSPQNV